MSEHDDAQRAYKSIGCAVLRSEVSAELCDFLSRYLLLLDTTGGLEPDGQVAGSAAVYGDPVFETLLVDLLPIVAAVADTDLAPTYSFARLYKRGGELTAHTDRPACEHSVTLHLGASPDGGWPLYFRGGDGLDLEAALSVGDAAVYRGCELLHWRQPYEGDWYAQAFLHYVDPEGPASSHALDGRISLARPKQRPTPVAPLLGRSY